MYQNSMLCRSKCNCTVAEIIVLLLHKDFVFRAAFTMVPTRWTASANSLASHPRLSTQGDLRLSSSLSLSSAPSPAPTITITRHTTLTFDSLHHDRRRPGKLSLLALLLVFPLPKTVAQVQWDPDWSGRARVGMKQT